MEKNKNRAFMALGSLGAVLLLLGAFTLVWLTPRGPDISNANVSTGPSLSPSSGSLDKLSQSPISSVSAAAVTDQPHISVHGTGIISAKPDIINLQVGVQIQNTALASAQSEAANKMDAAMKQLKAAGIDDKDISTAQYNVEPVMDYSQQNAPPRVTGFRITNILNVKLRDITKAGKTIDDLVSAGANTVYGLSFGFSDPTALMKQAREQAMNDAKAKAGELATLGGVTLGTPIIIDDSGSNTPPVIMDTANKSMGAVESAQAPTPINPGQQQIQVEVSVIYAIK